MGVQCWEKSPCRGLTLHTRSNSPSRRTSGHLLLIYEGHHDGRVRLRCHPRNWMSHRLDFTSSNSSSKGACHVKGGQRLQITQFCKLATFSQLRKNIYKILKTQIAAALRMAATILKKLSMSA